MFEKFKFFSLYIHISSRSYLEKKLFGFKNPENGLFYLVKKDKKIHQLFVYPVLYMLYNDKVYKI